MRSVPFVDCTVMMEYTECSADVSILLSNHTVVFLSNNLSTAMWPDPSSAKGVVCKISEGPPRDFVVLTVTSSHTCSVFSQKEMRHHVVRFLLETEQSYVQSLKTIIKVSKLSCDMIQVFWLVRIDSSCSCVEATLLNLQPYKTTGLEIEFGTQE